MVSHPRASNLIFAAAGVTTTGNREGFCRSCGTELVGIPAEQWIKKTFTDHDKLVPGTIICEACLFCFDDHNPVLTRMLARDKPQRMRNYSHVVHQGQWYPLGKDSKRQIAKLMLSRPDCVVLALSGQKHIIFRCPAGWWQIEETSVLPFPALLAELLGIIMPLYQGGMTKQEIATARYPLYKIAEFGTERWQALNTALRRHRNTLPFETALWLVQKEEEQS